MVSSGGCLLAIVQPFQCKSLSLDCWLISPLRVLSHFLPSYHSFSLYLSLSAAFPTLERNWGERLCMALFFHLPTRKDNQVARFTMNCNHRHRLRVLHSRVCSMSQKSNTGQITRFVCILINANYECGQSSHKVPSHYPFSWPRVSFFDDLCLTLLVKAQMFAQG